MNRAFLYPFGQLWSRWKWKI